MPRTCWPTVNLPAGTLIFLLLLMLSGSAFAQLAQSKGDEFSIELLAPGYLAPGNNLPPLLTTSGWPITLKLSADLHQTGRGIASNFTGEKYPRDGNTAWFVFSDLDGCPSYRCEKQIIDGKVVITCPPIPKGTGYACDSYVKSGVEPPLDEVFLQFTPSVDKRPTLYAELPPEDKPDPYSGLKRLPDQVGTGMNPKIPGLIVIADRGAGVLVGDAPSFPDTGRANLAKYFTSIGYSLAENCVPDKPCKSSVTAQMVVPNGLLAPRVLIDQAVNGGSVPPGTPNTYEAMQPIKEAICAARTQSAWMELGRTKWALTTNGLGNGYATLLSAIGTRVRVQAVLVNGPAPDSLPGYKESMNLESYLKKNHYEVLSKVRELPVDLYYQESDTLSVSFFDIGYNPATKLFSLPGNGIAACGLVAPAAPLDREEPPR